MPKPKLTVPIVKKLISIPVPLSEQLEELLSCPIRSAINGTKNVREYGALSALVTRLLKEEVERRKKIS